MMPKKTYTFAEAKLLLARYCAYQERSHQEVEQKLYKMGMITEAKEQIIMYLLAHDFLNEERFAKAFVSGKFRIKKWGRIKITQALRQKGVSPANITIGLAEIDEGAYLETLCGLRHFDRLSVNLAQSDPSTQPVLSKVERLRVNQKEPQLAFKEKQKLIRYLQQKGYELALIYECLRE